VSPRNLLAVTAALLTFAGTVTVAAPAAAAEAAFRPTNDAFTKESEPTTLTGSRSWLTANGEAGRHKRIYLKFKVRGVPAGARNVRATLRLHARTTAARPVQVHASRSVDWTEGTLYHGQRPGYRRDVVASVPRTTAGRWATFDVSGAVQANGFVTLVVTVPDSGDTLFTSREARGNWPQLRVRWTGGAARAPAPAPGPAPAPAPRPAAVPREVPPSGRLWGASVTDTGSWDASVAAHEANIGRRLEIAHNYHQWGDAFPTAAEKAVAARGTDLFLAWKPSVPWRAVANGSQDAVIDAAASRVAAHGRRVYLAFHHEPEDQVGSSYGSAGDYAAAFRHVVQRFRARGVGNVTWVWNVMGAQKWYGLYTGGLYPGDDVVDWIAWDPYNWGACRGEAWASFWAVVRPFYDWLGAHGHGDKPFMLGEYGTVDDPGQPGRKATWFARQIEQLGNFPNLRALVYFDRNQDCDWRVGSAPGSLGAYRVLSAAAG
jgi:hypothetical protein